MEKQMVEARVEEMLSPFLAKEGLELVAIEYKNENNNLYLRIFIDKPGGVGLEDCELVSKHIGAELEGKAIIPHRYFLEVSSPGVERPLYKPEDFLRFRGSAIKLRTIDKIEGGRNFQGELADYSNDLVVLETEDGRLLKIPYSSIEKARLKIY